VVEGGERAARRKSGGAVAGTRTRSRLRDLSSAAKIWQERFIFRDFYFRAPGSLVVFSFPQPLNFSLVFPSL
jgi:hypothetical protein